MIGGGGDCGDQALNGGESIAGIGESLAGDRLAYRRPLPRRLNPLLRARRQLRQPLRREDGIGRNDRRTPLMDESCDQSLGK